MIPVWTLLYKAATGTDKEQPLVNISAYDEIVQIGAAPPGITAVQRYGWGILAIKWPVYVDLGTALARNGGDPQPSATKLNFSGKRPKW